MKASLSPVVASLVLLGAPALAQPSAQSEAQALALFKDAIAALDKGDYASGCPKFDAAMKLYPSPATQLNLARCLEHDGKLASAWAAYQRVLVLNRETKEEQRREALTKLANDGAAALDKRLPRVRVVVPTAAPGAKVTEDGQELPEASWGEPLPVDPGPHEIAASAPGFAPWKATVTAAEGRVADVTVALTASGVPDAAPTGPPPGKESAATPPASHGPPVWAWVVGGVGVALGAAAAGFRVDWANIDSKQAAAGCGPALTTCPKSYTSLASDNAQKDRDRALAIGLGVAGGVGVAAGLVGIVVGVVRKPSAPAAARVLPWVGAGAGGVSVLARF